MKGLGKVLTAVTTLALASSFALTANAAIIASDNASNADYNDGWQNGDGGGFGFGVWTNVVASDADKGNFLGDSTGNGGGGGGGINTTVGPDANVSTARSWGSYAESDYPLGTLSTFDANRSMPALAVGNKFYISMDNGYINGPGDAGTDGSTGFNLRTSAFADRLLFQFKGGDANYFVMDNSGFVNTGVGFTDAGLNLVFTLTGADTYSLDITPVGGSTTTVSGTLAGTAGSLIEDLRVFNQNTKRFDGDFAPSDQFFNSLALDNIPEPSTVTLVGLSLLGAFLMRRNRK